MTSGCNHRGVRPSCTLVFLRSRVETNEDMPADCSANWRVIGGKSGWFLYSLTVFPFHHFSHPPTPHYYHPLKAGKMEPSSFCNFLGFPSSTPCPYFFLVYLIHPPTYFISLLCSFLHFSAFDCFPLSCLSCWLGKNQFSPLPHPFNFSRFTHECACASIFSPAKPSL